MITSAVKNSNHDLLRRIVAGQGPKVEGFSNDMDTGTVHVVDGMGDTPLIWACMRGDEESVDILLDAGANISTGSTLDGDTPLIRAARYGHERIVLQLLDSRTSAKEKIALVNHTNIVNILTFSPLQFFVNFLEDSLSAFSQCH
jgi:hypothetical protein